MIPRISLLVGGCALTFQATVLYPWHNKISDEISKLRVSVDNLSVKEKVEQKKVVGDSSCPFVMKPFFSYPIFNQKKYMNFVPMSPRIPPYVFSKKSENE